MSILINEKTRVLVQGITGREGMVRTLLMKEYGTNVVAGVTPGKAGTMVHGVPVYDSVAQAVEKEGPMDASAVFIPAPQVKAAALEAMESGIKFMLLVPDRVPIYDVLEICAVAKEKGVRFQGPNTLGILSVDKAVMGMIGGSARSAKSWFKPGPVGVCSRSGGITSSMSYYLNQEGIGQTTICHVGGDAIIGLPLNEMVKFFEKDPETLAVVMFGEIGGSQEEEIAELIKKGEVTKPLVAYIGGRAAKSGTRFSHAGAIVEGNRGTWEGKVKALREAGATVVEEFGDLPRVTKDVLARKGITATQKVAKPTGEKWPTAITKIEPNRIYLRGYKLDELMGKISYSQAVFLALRGEMPSEKVGRLIEAILVASIDHGVTPPSALAALNVATTGASLTAALAAGILSISEFHGGAIEQGMRLIGDGLKRSKEKNASIQDTALEIIKVYRESKKRLHGFGHRIHTDDPRTKKLFALAEELGLSGEGVKMAKALEGAFGKHTGKRLPVNVDGAIAALLVDLGFEPEIGNAFFIIARVPGLIAHIREEKTRFAPMRVIEPRQFEYDGPPERRLE